MSFDYQQFQQQKKEAFERAQFIERDNDFLALCKRVEAGFQDSTRNRILEVVVPWESEVSRDVLAFLTNATGRIVTQQTSVLGVSSNLWGMLKSHDPFSLNFEYKPSFFSNRGVSGHNIPNNTVTQAITASLQKVSQENEKVGIDRLTQPILNGLRIGSTEMSFSTPIPSWIADMFTDDLFKCTVTFQPASGFSYDTWIVTFVPSEPAKTTN